ncbi:hypothetical protein K461DRAFT_9137 [Myriangium duriaei CBS 260.36]|uniref:SET domain-containing protein n=1 Tax=Myriangium duriaei CBS 260.36 TaxID=1168546 RepID=A0A9P4ML48_9PEZI|nr:hypothetical protein K461DRAFT_9137 [Myriangium duriaei CBS 260.36]
MTTASTASTLPSNWPEHIPFLPHPIYSPSVSASTVNLFHTPTSTSVSWPKLPSSALTSPCPHVLIRPITSQATHPANGQNGLFASAHLAPGSFIIAYVGRVHTDAPSDTDPASDYDLSLDRDLGLAIDAAQTGNEARFINDYRGVADAANAEFKDCWVQMPAATEGGRRKWERRMGVFVLSAGKAGKRARGIQPGQEILINYGRSFWKERKEGV